MRRFVSILLLCGLFVSSASALAQAPPPPPPPRPPAAPDTPPPPPPPSPAQAIPRTAVRIDILVERSKGATKVSSLPYSIATMAYGNGKEQPASLRFGSSVPIPTVGQGGGTTFTYQSIGTDIDTLLSVISEGRYQLNLTVEDSSVGDQDASADGRPRAPIIRSYRINTTLLLRSGVTVPVNLSTDRISGETVTAQVTVTALKP